MARHELEVNEIVNFVAGREIECASASLAMHRNQRKKLTYLVGLKQYMVTLTTMDKKGRHHSEEIFRGESVEEAVFQYNSLC